MDPPEREPGKPAGRARRAPFSASTLALSHHLLCYCPAVNFSGAWRGEAGARASPDSALLDAPPGRAPICPLRKNAITASGYASDMRRVCIGYASCMNQVCIRVGIKRSPFMSNWVRGVWAHARLAPNDNNANITTPTTTTTNNNNNNNHNHNDNTAQKEPRSSCKGPLPENHKTRFPPPCETYTPKRGFPELPNF